MLSATQCLGAVMLSPTPSHGSFTSGGTAPSPGHWAPRHRAVSRSVRSSSLSEANVQNGQAVGTIEHEQQTLFGWWPHHQELITLKAMVTLRLKEGESTPGKVAEMVNNRQWLVLEFFSSELDPETGKEKHTVPKAASFSRTLQHGFFEYEVDLSDVASSFRAVGAVQVESRFDSEVHIKAIEVVVAPQEQDHDHHKKSVVVTTFPCNSWVTHNPGDKRVFFPVESSCIPSKTPHGVRRLRKKELEAIRGDGQGDRRERERVYDYDVYNDLGNPDADPVTRRPVLGGKERPYPRRCRTGRPRSKTDPSSEARAQGDIYVPRDEQFTELKQGAFQTKKTLLGLSSFITTQQVGKDTHRSFPSLAAIDALYEDGYRNLPSDQQAQAEGFNAYLKDLLQKEVDNLLHGETEKIKEDIRRLFKFQTPEIHDKDKLAWFRDEEFARQTLAGLNPLSIQLVRELPIVSKLDEETYGPGDSLITKELIEEHINGVMTAEEAVKKKKLFMLDYHDLLLPYVHKVRELDDTTLYGSRTLFFLTEEGTLRPIAIELTRPKSMTKPQWRQVFTPASSSATGSWLWELAKTHVLSHDTGYHQLISHWLRTHCSVEPYIIAANRQLSQMHPIYRLLHPHFRFTMEINSLARAMLINAGGAIESTFSLGKYSMEFSSAVYDKVWQFDKEALPEDLIRRGMAEAVLVEGQDGKPKRELKLTIEDYPYANDGLLVWDAIKEWASAYVKHYYPHAADIVGDEELQGWWTEVCTKGHGDKQHATWWPKLDSHDSLVQVLSTIMWVASAHHAAVNFGQYPFAGYFPSHPTTARRNMPTEEQDMRSFMEDPEKVLLDTFPSQYQSAIFLPMLNLLSMHMPGEQYLGTHEEPAWMADGEMKAAFFRFNGKMMEIAEQINRWNKDKNRKNRYGPGVVPYVLLKPSYGDPKDMKSVMEMGIPNSISI